MRFAENTRQLTELAERLDFAERVLAQQRPINGLKSPDENDVLTPVCVETLRQLALDEFLDQLGTRVATAFIRHQEPACAGRLNVQRSGASSEPL